jgi:Ca2+-binding RTX toxin-like protein
MVAVPLGTPFLVNGIDTGNQIRPAITALATGGFAIAWQDGSGAGSSDLSDDIRFALYDAFGNRLSPGLDRLANTQLLSAQFEPKIAGLSNGGFVLVWTDAGEAGPDFDNRSIKAQVFNASGVKVGSEISVNTTFPLSQDEPSVTVLANGRFVVTWSSEIITASSTTDIIGRVFTAAGAPVTGEFTINTQKVGDQVNSTVHALDSGGFAVVWDDREASAVTGNQVKTYIRFYAANGAPQGQPKLANDALSGDPQQLDFAELSTGRIAVVYTNLDGFGTGDGSGGSIYVRLYNPATQAFGARIAVNTTTTRDQTDPQIAALDNGQFVVVWTDDSRTGGDTNFQAVRMQVFNQNGAKVGTEILVNTATTFEQVEPVVTVLPDFRFVVAWADNSQTGGDAEGFAIRSRIYDARIAAIDLDGTTGRDSFQGSKFADTIDGLGGNDKLFGGIGNDIIIGGLGIDLLRGDAGNDKLDGGNDNDNVSGGVGNDSLTGGSGNDTLNGGAGNDTLVGGLNNDIFVFNAALDPATNVDRITDFNVTNDTVQLDDAVFAGIANLGASLNPAFFRIGAAAADANDRIIYNSANGQLFYDANGNAAGGVKLFAVLAPGLALTPADFVVI